MPPIPISLMERSMHALPCGEPEGKVPDFSPPARGSPGKTKTDLWMTVRPARAITRNRPTFVMTEGSGLGLYLDGDRNSHVAVEFDGELVRAHLLDHLTDDLTSVQLKPDLGGQGIGHLGDADRAE